MARVNKVKPKSTTNFVIKDSSPSIRLATSTSSINRDRSAHRRNRPLGNSATGSCNVFL